MKRAMPHIAFQSHVRSTCNFLIPPLTSCRIIPMYIQTEGTL
jgi:hypothetical protein